MRAIWSNFPWQARRIQPAPKPADLDWVRFVGNTPYTDYDAARYDSWRYFPEYGGGVLADILNHWADVAQWMMNDCTPLNAVSSSGVYQLHDGRANPDTVNAILQYSLGIFPLNRPCCLFETTGQRSFSLARKACSTSLAIAMSSPPTRGTPERVAASGSLELAHAKNLLDCIRTGKKPNADVDIALQGVLPCHLARAAYWSGSACGTTQPLTKLRVS